MSQAFFLYETLSSYMLYRMNGNSFKILQNLNESLSRGVKAVIVNSMFLKTVIKYICLESRILCNTMYVYYLDSR